MKKGVQFIALLSSIFYLNCTFSEEKNVDKEISNKVIKLFTSLAEGSSIDKELYPEIFYTPYSDTDSNYNKTIKNIDDALVLMETHFTENKPDISRIKLSYYNNDDIVPYGEGDVLEITLNGDKKNSALFLIRDKKIASLISVNKGGKIYLLKFWDIKN
jgi:hypothetical protein